MALSTYDELKSSLAGWLHRQELNATANGVGVDSVVEDWVTLFEAEINRKLRLRVMESDEAITWVASSRFITLPTGYLEPLGLWITLVSGEEPRPLRQVPLASLRRGVTDGQPFEWAVDGTRLAFDCPADQAYTGVFRMLKSFALSDASPTNWLLTNYPNLYLYGSLRHSPLYLMQDKRAGGWNSYYQDALATLEESEARKGNLVTLSTDLAQLQRPGRYDINADR